MQLSIRPDIPTWKEYMDRTDLWEIQHKMHIEIQTDLIPGVLIYDIHPGYITDFRSGPSIVNPFIPKIGDIKLAMAWMVHDINYHGFLSKKYSDQLLREMLEYAGISKLKRNSVYYAVKFFAGSHYNTLDEDQGPIYNHNKTLVDFKWADKGQVIKKFTGRKLKA